MTEQSLSPSPDDAFRAIEAEFASRPDHQPNEMTPALITMPTEGEFAQMAAEREAREQAARQRQEAIYREWGEREKRETWKRRMKKVMAATAILVSFKNGGLIDMAGDQFSDAGNVAADAIAEPKVQIPDELDGIKFEDYSASAQADILADEETSIEAQSRARDTVIDLFHDVDEHGYDSLILDVREQQATHPELYPSAEQIERTNDAIERATSNQEALNALSDFMSFYGIEAGFHEDAFDDKASEVKDIMKAYVKVFSALPKDFIDLAKLERVTINNGPLSDASGAGTEAGSYGSNEIDIIPNSALIKFLSPVEEFLQGDDFSYEGTVAHELGHALDENITQSVAAHLPEDESTDGLTTGQVLKDAGRNFIKRPETISSYSRTSSEEHVAELLSGVLSDRSNGLASVDNWREFGSEANKAMIETLARLEALRPGIAKILIANRVS